MKNQNYNILRAIRLLGAIVCFLPLLANSQVKEVLVGEQIPNVTISNIVNYRTANAKISDFSGKLLVLDFWAPWCSPCVAMFPKTDSLEKQFDGKVLFLPIAKEPKKKISDFLNNMSKVRHIKPISVVEDTLFSQFFHYSLIPYYVWINKDGRVIATTGPEDVTSENIKKILEGKSPSFENRTDIRRREIDFRKSIFVLSDNFKLIDTTIKREELSRPEILSYSIATKSIPNAGGYVFFSEDQFGAYNISIEYLYRYAYNIGYYEDPVRGAFDSKKNHVFEISNSKLLDSIRVSNTIKGGTQEMNKWINDFAVTYEMVYPKNISWKDKMNLLRQGLDRTFAEPMGFAVNVVKRTDSAQVLQLIGNKSNLVTKGGNAEEHHDRYTYIQHNLPLSHFVGLLKGYFFQESKLSILDQTKMTAPVDLELNCDMTDLNSLNKALIKYGLQFTKKSLVIDVLVFSDKHK